MVLTKTKSKYTYKGHYYEANQKEFHGVLALQRTEMLFRSIALGQRDNVD